MSKQGYQSSGLVFLSVQLWSSDVCLGQRWKVEQEVVWESLGMEMMKCFRSGLKLYGILQSVYVMVESLNTLAFLPFWGQSLSNKPRGKNTLWSKWHAKNGALFVVQG